MLEEIVAALEHGRRTGRLSAEALHGIPALADAPTVALHELSSAADWRLYHRGETVAGPPLERPTAFLPVVGAISVCTCSEGGKRLVLCLLPEEQCLAPAWLPAALLDVSWVEAAEASAAVVLKMPADSLRRCAPAESLVAQAQHLQDGLAQLLLDLAFHDVTTRIAHALARLVDRHGGDAVPLTHREIAELSATSREDVTRALHLFEAGGLVRAGPHRREVHITDANALRRWPLRPGIG